MQNGNFAFDITIDQTNSYFTWTVSGLSKNNIMQMRRVKRVLVFISTEL